MVADLGLCRKHRNDTAAAVAGVPALPGAQGQDQPGAATGPGCQLRSSEQHQTRIGPRTEGDYSTGHINKYIQALKLFSPYIRQTGRTGIGFTLAFLEDTRDKPDWLTRPEIRRLYEAINDDVLGIRDRAMLAVYYGCGLRLSEGAALTLSDMIADRKLLYVRKGKGI